MGHGGEKAFVSEIVSLLISMQRNGAESANFELAHFFAVSNGYTCILMQDGKTTLQLSQTCLIN